MGVIRVKDLDDRHHYLEAVEGWRVMEIIRDQGFDIGGLCGGACACATCHVTVDPEWAAKLHPANDDEEARLDERQFVDPTSRLSCQLIYSDSLSDLTITLASAA